MKRKWKNLEIKTSSRQCAFSCVASTWWDSKPAWQRQEMMTRLLLQPTISTTAACLSLPDGAMDGDANEQRRDPAMPCHATYGAHHVFRQRQHTKKMEGEENDGQRPATWEEYAYRQGWPRLQPEPARASIGSPVTYYTSFEVYTHKKKGNFAVEHRQKT